VTAPRQTVQTGGLRPGGQSAAASQQTGPRRALIVAHGQPSDPDPAEAALARLAAEVAARLPAGWQVDSATLAAPAALEAALTRGGGAPLLIYPMFIADGWFTQVNLPARIRAAGIELAGWERKGSGAAGSGGSCREPDCRGPAGEAAETADAPPAAGPRARILPPFGLDDGILPLALQMLRAELSRDGLRASDVRLIVAAHGSFKSPAPALVARRLGWAIMAELPFAELRTAFIDQTPRIADLAAGLAAPAYCLPFFAAAGGHVGQDLPAALAQAAFSGRILAPLGLADRAPDLIAAALLAGSGDSAS